MSLIESDRDSAISNLMNRTAPGPDNTTTDVGPEEARLVANQLQFTRAITSSMAEGVYALDANGLVTFVNPAAERILGWTETELLGRCMHDVIHFQDCGGNPLPAAECRLLSVLNTGEVISVGEDYFTRKDGTLFPVSYTSSPIMRTGSVVGGVLTFRDITEQKWSEAALRESERRFRTMLENLRLVAMTVDTEGQVTFCNDYLLELTGYERQDVHGRNWFDTFIAAEGRDELKRVFSELLAGAEMPTHHENEILTQTGAARVISWNNTLLRDSAGAVVGIASVGEDVTESRLEARVLSRYRLLSEHSRDIMLFVAQDGRIVEANRMAVEAYGYDRGELLGKTIYELRADDTAPLVSDQMGRADAKGLLFETVHRRKDGTTFDVEVSSAGADFGDDRVLLSVIRDITERKRTGEALKRKNRALAVLGRGSHALTRATEESQLLRDLCEAVVSEGGYRMAWVGRAEEDEVKSVRPVAQAGFEDGYLERIGVTWSDGERGAGPVGRAIRENRVCVVRDTSTDASFAPWRGEALRQGYRSVIALPLSSGTIGHMALGIYADEPDAFDEEELALLRQLADDITSGLLALRAEAGRAKAETALIRSEAQFRAVFEHTGIGVTLVDTGGRLLQVNPAFESMLGYAPGEMESLTFAQVSHPDDIKIDIALFRELLCGARDQYQIEKRYLRKDGQVVWGQLNASLIRDAGGEIVYVVGSITDITERKRGEEQLIRISRAVEGASDAIRISDLEARSTFHNSSFVRLFGYTVEELNAAGGASVLFLDEGVGGEVLATGLNGRSWRGEVELRGWDGRVIVADISHDAVYDEGGNCIGVIGVYTDVTERKQMQDALRRSEELYRGLVENAKDMIITHDLEGNYTSVNRAALELTGYTLEEALAMNLSQAIAPEYVEKAQRMIAKKIAGEEEETIYDLEILAKDASRIVVEVSSWLVCKDGQPVGVQAIGRDIGERRQLEEQLRQAQKMEAVGRLAGGVAHDFNNILTAITGYSDLALRRLKPFDPVLRNIEEVRKAANRAASLTQQLLAFSRKQIMQPKVVDLNQLVEDSAKMLRRLIGEDIEVITRFEPRLDRVLADPGQVEQVLMNLVVNARDAMPRGGRITVATANVRFDEEFVSHHAGARLGHYVMLSVSDTGTGMDEKTKAQIFEPFFTTKEVGKGTGLGLSTVYGIVKQSEGYVWVDSEVEVGTTLRIYLPRADGAAGQAGTAEQRAKMADGWETVLIVEDDATLRRLAREILQTFGYHVLTAASGEEARRCLEDYEGEVHLLLTDVVMPGMSGRELDEAVRGMRPMMKTLLMSGYTDDSEVLRGVLEEGLAFLQKPFTPDALSKKVREVIDSPPLS